MLSDLHSAQKFRAELEHAAVAAAAAEPLSYQDILDANSATPELTPPSLPIREPLSIMPSGMKIRQIERNRSFASKSNTFSSLNSIENRRYSNDSSRADQDSLIERIHFSVQPFATLSSRGSSIASSATNANDMSSSLAFGTDAVVERTDAFSRTLATTQPHAGLPLRSKIVLVGDGAVGKTCLISYYSTGAIPEGYIPTVFSNITVNLSEQGNNYELAVWDTAGQDDYARLRPLAYPDTDAFLLCFSVESRESFVNAKSKWLPEIRHYCPHTPVLLVGLKSDLRHDPKYMKKCVTAYETEECIRDGIVDKYIECSARTGAQVPDVLGAAARLATSQRKSRRYTNKKCIVM